MALETLKITFYALEYSVREKVPPEMGKTLSSLVKRDVQFLDPLISWCPEAESNCRHEDFQLVLF